MSQQPFPEHPRVGQTVTAPPDDNTPGLTLITLLNEAGEIVGTAQSLHRVSTSERKYILRHTIADAKEFDAPITVRVTYQAITSYIFLEDCGWTPRVFGPPTVIFKRRGTLIDYVSALTILTLCKYTLYNELCLDLPPGDENKEQDG